MTKLKCLRCKKEWNYKGKKKYDKEYSSWTSCPKCKTSVKIKKQEEVKEGNDGTMEQIKEQI